MMIKVPMCQHRRRYAGDRQGDMLYFMVGAMSEPTADPALQFSVW